MKKQSLIVLLVAAVAVAFLFSAGYAADPADTMTMNSKVYDKHTKAQVVFSHKKHSAEYKIACADCHHVIKDGKNTWKEGDPVQKCEACHSEAKPPAGKDAPEMTKEQKIAKYHYTAIHENCVGCHKAEKAKGKNAPAACKDCHPGKE